MGKKINLYNVEATKPDDIKKRYELIVKPYEELDKNFFKVCRGIFILKDSKAIHLYIYLCSCYNSETKKVFPSYETIQQATGLDRNTIANKLKILKRLKLIQINKRKKGTYCNNDYVISYIDEIYEKTTENELDIKVKLDFERNIGVIEDIDIDVNAIEQLEDDDKEDDVK